MIWLKKPAAHLGGRFVCGIGSRWAYRPWAIMAVEIFLKAAMSLPAIRS